jgi:predicted dehydrogenase
MSTLKWGLIGYGDLADKRVAAALREAYGSTLTGVWGRDAGKTQEFASRHEIENAHASLDELLQSDVNAIYVCTPPDSHAEYSLAALEAGKHILVEKPMASSADECKAMIAKAAEKNLTLGIAYYRRAYPKMQQIKKLIDEGVLGTPTWVNIAAHSWFDPASDDPKHWRVEKNKSGGAGALADIGVHRLDLLDYWLGESKVLFSDLQHLVQDYEVEDGASAVLQLKNGAPVHCYFSWNSKTWVDRFEIVGSEGKIIAEPLDGPSLVVIRGRDREELQIEAPTNAHLPYVEDFVRAVNDKSTPLCDGEAGLRTNQLLETIVANAS